MTTNDQLHIKLFIDKGNDDPTPGVSLREKSQVFRESTFDMFKNLQLSFKIKVLVEFSPLKFKLEYYDTNNCKLLNHNQLIQFRGSIYIFVSRSTDNTQQVYLQMSDPTNNCERFFQNKTPPQTILLSSNLKM